jgi:molybdate transport system ATP-binding protein
VIDLEIAVGRGDFSLDATWREDVRVAGLYGPTGCGKTTILLAIAGLLRPSRGRIAIDGQTLFDASRNQWVAPEDRGIGMVFQDLRLFPHLSVVENLRFGRTRAQVPGPGFDDVVNVLALEPLLDRTVSGLSGGESRLVAVGRALLSRPRLLLLDEPLTGLDPALRRRVLAHLLRIKERFDVRMLLVSHVFSDFLALADAMALLERGRLVTTGAPSRLVAKALHGGGEERLETTLTGTVESEDGNLARVRVNGTALELFLSGAAAGRDALLTILAQDVLIGVGAPPRTSARNVLEGRIEALERVNGAVYLRVNAGPTIWAEVTEDAVRELGLAPGSRVYGLVKASAIRGVVS